MRISSALNPALTGAVLLTLSSLGAGAPAAYAQQAKANSAGRARNLVHPRALPRLMRGAPMPVPRTVAPSVRPAGSTGTSKAPFTRVPIPRVRPIAAPPTSMPKPVMGGPRGQVVVPPIQPAARGIAPFRFPPRSRRLLPAPPPASKPATASHGSSRVSSPLPPPGSRIYCSPNSALYNMGSLCFNPKLYTIDPAFFPWGLWSPPPFINVPGFVSPFVIGLLVRYCPQCAAGGLKLATGPKPFGEEELHPRRLPPYVFPNPAGKDTATPDPPATAPTPRTAVSGPPVILVLENGSTALVSRYWLGQDWRLHFVTVTGEQRAIPLNALNLESTGAVNYARGVTFVMPGWPEPRTKD